MADVLRLWDSLLSDSLSFTKQCHLGFVFQTTLFPGDLARPHPLLCTRLRWLFYIPSQQLWSQVQVVYNSDRCFSRFSVYSCSAVLHTEATSVWPWWLASERLVATTKSAQGLITKTAFAAQLYHGGKQQMPCNNATPTPKTKTTATLKTYYRGRNWQVLVFSLHQGMSLYISSVQSELCFQSFASTYLWYFFKIVLRTVHLDLNLETVLREEKPIAH